MPKASSVGFRRVFAGAAAITILAGQPAAASASAASPSATSTAGGFGVTRLVRISSDPYTDPSAQHATEDDPGIASFGSTVVSAFQQGLFGEAGAGGAASIGFATSDDRGRSWIHGSLPGV